MSTGIIGDLLMFSHGMPLPKSKKRTGREVLALQGKFQRISSSTCKPK